MSTRHWRVLLAALMVIGLLLAVRPLTSNAEPERMFTHADKVGHVLYFVLLWLLARRAGLRGAWPLATALLGFGLFIEVAQALMPTHRSASLSDVVADAAGISLAWWFDRRGLPPSAGEPEKDRG